jgi:hypothetical protein
LAKKSPQNSKLISRCPRNFYAVSYSWYMIYSWHDALLICWITIIQYWIQYWTVWIIILQYCAVWSKKFFAIFTFLRFKIWCDCQFCNFYNIFFHSFQNNRNLAFGSLLNLLIERNIHRRIIAAKFSWIV